MVIGDSTAGNQSLSSWVNAKVTPEAIWLGVVRHTTGNNNATIGSGTSLSITDDSFLIASTGTLSVDTSNVIINTAATENNAIFRIGGTGENYKLLYSENAGLKIKGEIAATAGNLGGWILGEHKLYSGSGTNYVALDSGTSNEGYALWAGNGTSGSAPFAVMRNG